LRNSFSLAAAALAAALVSAACGTARDAAGPTDTPSDAASSVKAPPTLLGPTWRLVSLDGREAIPGVRVTAVFGEDDRVAGSAGCNGYFGRATAKGDQLAVGLLGSTLMHCGAEGVMAQEQAYLAALGKATTYRLVGSGLELGPAPGVVTLTFKPE
jgi:heat shock protein HslJ